MSSWEICHCGQRINVNFGNKNCYYLVSDESFEDYEDKDFEEPKGESLVLRVWAKMFGQGKNRVIQCPQCETIMLFREGRNQEPEIYIKKEKEDNQEVN